MRITYKFWYSVPPYRVQLADVHIREAGMQFVCSALHKHCTVCWLRSCKPIHSHDPAQDFLVLYNAEETDHKRRSIDRWVIVEFRISGTQTVQQLQQESQTLVTATRSVLILSPTWSLSKIPWLGETQSQAVDIEKAGLSFSDVCVDVGEKRILWSVSGNAKPGKILALMGPSGKRLDQIIRGLGVLCTHHQLYVYRFREDYSSQLLDWLHSTQLRLHYSAWTSDEQESSASDQLCPSGWYLLSKPDAEGDTSGELLALVGTDQCDKMMC